MKQSISSSIHEHLALVSALSNLESDIVQMAHTFISCLNAGGKIVWMGNGGSAADSQHLASELVGRFQRSRRGLASVALTTDSSILTSVGNDFGFEQIFARQVEAICRAGDLVVGISTSGNSRNIIAAIDQARTLGIGTVCLLGGNGGELRHRCDQALLVPSTSTPRVQEVHILIGHILCELVENALQP